MADPRAVLRVIDELVWSMRRAGITIATSQAIDCARAIHAVGFDDRETVREALACVLVARANDRPRFDRIFDVFFAHARDTRDLWARLEAHGVSKEEADAVRSLLLEMGAASSDGASLAALLGRGAELDRLLSLAGAARSIDTLESPLQSGFFAHKLTADIGVGRARKKLGDLRARLAELLGQERADSIADALLREMDAAADEARAWVRSELAWREEERRALAGDRKIATAAFPSLDPVEIEEVRRAVRVLVERLRGGERVRARRARKGRVHPHATLRRALATGGVPLTLIRRARRRNKPRLVMLCDISDSVRAVARFLLELVYAAQELFARTRTFVFVSELGETTRLFEEFPLPRALEKAYGGAVVSIAANSNYGRVLRGFEERHLQSIDRRTTVVILGDGRTNYLDDASYVLDRIRGRARALYWLCPESRDAWNVGDSAMNRYAPKTTRVMSVRCARELEEAARAIAAARW